MPGKLKYMSTPLRIGLFGYGKMGRAIEQVALEQGMEIVWRIGRNNRTDATPDFLQQADVIIEFSRPEAAFDNVMDCLRAGVPVVSGTTGWSDTFAAAQAFCLNGHAALLWASNFSVGVNLFFAVNRHLAALMNHRPEYSPSVTETHHIHKLDAPSGTALTLVNDALQVLDSKSGWVLGPATAGAQDIVITAIREGEVPGTHTVTWTSAVDEISITHCADSRLGFATGAVVAARWLVGRKGVFGMQDVLGI